MKPSYITVNFQQTAAQRFPAQADELSAAFTARLQALRAENAGASQEKQRHLENQILPGIAAYETLQSVMSKEEALQDRKSTRLNSSHDRQSRMPSSA